MPPENLELGGGTAETIVHPIVVIAMVVAILLVFALRRRYVILPILAMSLLIPPGQVFVIGGLHVFVLRLMILAGLSRKVISHWPITLCRVDKVFLLWGFCHVAAFLFLFGFTPEVLSNRFGFIWDCIGGFWLLRSLIQDSEDIRRVSRFLVFVAFVTAVGMSIEHWRMVNVFALLGKGSAVPEMRDGMVRAKGPFNHPLLAGAYGSTVLPIFFMLWRWGRSRVAAGVGLVSSTVIVLFCGASTGILSYAAAIAAVCFWPFRKQMRLFRWAVLIVLVSLHIVMKAPVWALIGRISLYDSSSSGHRAALVDSFIRNFGDWWLIGTNNNAAWGMSMWDTANQFVEEGIRGGLGAFICFVAIVSMSFGTIGKARRRATSNRNKEWMLWLLGSALFANVVAFFGISYFDQTRMYWYTVLAMVVAATSESLPPDRCDAVDEKQAGLGLMYETNWSSHPTFQ